MSRIPFSPRTPSPITIIVTSTRAPKTDTQKKKKKKKKNLKKKGEIKKYKKNHNAPTPQVHPNRSSSVFTHSPHVIPLRPCEYYSRRTIR
jgi:hypothetical protein